MKQYKIVVICMCILLLLAGGVYAQQKRSGYLPSATASQDAVEQYLHELAEAEGISTIIGNMFIGGCSLERHVKMPVTMLLPMPTGKSVQMEKTGKG